MKVKIECIPGHPKLISIGDIPAGRFFTVACGGPTNLYLKMKEPPFRTCFCLGLGTVLSHEDCFKDPCAVILKNDNIQMDIKFSM